MLAYVFWHWPQADHAAAEYEHLQQAFHGTLAQSAPSGFRTSVVFRVEGSAPWLGGRPAYADWYLVDDFAALGLLNIAAVSGPAEQPHAAVAQAMAAGAGSLFALRGEQPFVVTARHANWLAKPRSMPYDVFFASIAALSGAAETSLWRRQMVLGPTPEFALLSPAPVPLPPTFQPLELELARVWPAG